MFDNLPDFVLAATGDPKTLIGWISASFIWICRGVIQGGFSKFSEHLVDSYCVKHGKEKKYNICQKEIDMSGKALGPVDWMVLESPVDPVPISMNLRGSSVTDQDLIDHLVGQKLLRKLDVCNCSGITYKGVKNFRKLRPDCRVRHNTLRFWNYLIGTIILGITMLKLIFTFV